MNDIREALKAARKYISAGPSKYARELVEQIDAALTGTERQASHPDHEAQQDKWHKQGFAQGIAVACSTLVGTWGDEVPVEEILCGACLDTRKKMKDLGVDDYDLDILKPVFKTLRMRGK